MTAPILAVPPYVVSSERLSCKTAIRSTRQGERRTTLRNPVLIMNYEFRGSQETSAMLDALYRKHTVGPWRIPVWTELVNLSQPTSGTVTTLTIPSGVGDYAAQKDVILFGSNDELIVKTITGVTITQSTAQISWVGGVAFSILALAPIRDAYWIGGMDRTFAAPNKRVSATFACVLPTTFGGSSFPQYEQLDVLTDPGVVVSSIPEMIREEVEFVSNDYGKVTPQVVKDYFFGAFQFTLRTNSPKEHWRIKSWFASLKGKAKPFWLPSWQEDFTLAEGVASDATYIDVVPTSLFPEVYLGAHIMIVEPGLPFLYREITATTTSGGGNWRFTISPPGRAVAIGAQIGLMRKVRLDTDEVEFNCLGSVFRDVTVSCREVPL